jgi:hypothetical protein
MLVFEKLQVFIFPNSIRYKFIYLFIYLFMFMMLLKW